MSTTTSVKMQVNLFERACVYLVNIILQLGFRVEHCRTPGGHYMAEYLEVIERGLKVWVTEQTLEKVHFEIYSPQIDKAYERCEVVLSYLDDPREEAVKPPIAEIEELMGRLEKLPPDARFRLLVTVKPGHTEVAGWGPPDRLKDFAGGLKEEHKVGTEHGYGHVFSRMTYYVSNWAQGGTPPR